MRHNAVVAFSVSSVEREGQNSNLIANCSTAVETVSFVLILEDDDDDDGRRVLQQSKGGERRAKCGERRGKREGKGWN